MRPLGVALFLLFEDAVEFLGRSFFHSGFLHGGATKTYDFYVRAVRTGSCSS